MNPSEPPSPTGRCWRAHLGVNAEHGQARTRSDVARILATIFEDPEWRAMPINQIAKHTRVPYVTVHRHYERAAASYPVGKIATPTSPPPTNRPTYPPKPAERTVTRGGSTYTMNTAGIGRGGPITPHVYEHDGAIFADSRQVAEAFGKRHAHVLRDIANIPENNANPNLGWLKPAIYIDAQGKERPFYELTKDGFTLLAMGFTGEKALATLTVRPGSRPAFQASSRLDAGDRRPHHRTRWRTVVRGGRCREGPGDRTHRRRSQAAR